MPPGNEMEYWDIRKYSSLSCTIFSTPIHFLFFLGCPFPPNITPAYTKQYHTPSSLRAQIAEYAVLISLYDGHVELLLHSVEDLEKAVQDPESCEGETR